MKKLSNGVLAWMMGVCVMLGIMVLPDVSVNAVDFHMWNLEIGTYRSNEKKEGIVEKLYDAETGIYQLQPIIYNEKHEILSKRGTLYVTLDGEGKVPLYWSEETYQNKNGKEQYVGVLKPQQEQGWTENTCVIWKPDWFRWEEDKIQIYAAASKDGPGELKLEYSLDGGETYLPMSNEPVKLKQERQEQDILKDISFSQEDIVKIQTAVKTMKFCVRISPASDTKLDGSAGLYGSKSGELALSEFSSHHWGFICYQPYPPLPRSTAEDLSVHKIADTKAKISWKRAGSRAIKYEIYQKKVNGNANSKFKKVRTIKVKDSDANENCSFTIKNLSKKGKYLFYVVATNAKGWTWQSENIKVNMKEELIPKDIKLAKKIVVKKGSRKKVPFTYKKGTKKKYVSDVQYTVGKKKIAVIKKGRIAAKKRGITNVKVKVTLKSGLQKTFKTKVVVK